ncbi:MAG: flavodoxin-dependent (E)-4-hydroxy-3-methylbut-2-enyl-diphosphate synthase, partial [Oleiharenicola lentus]
VMIQAYRLLVERMAREDMHYPLHLGVTEAGDGEDGRIKSAIGIGSLLLDGLGDTIRVSLTEDSVYEIPVAQAIAAKAMSLWRDSDLQVSGLRSQVSDSVDPYHFTRREPAVLQLSDHCVVGPEQPPRVIVRVGSVTQLPEAARALAAPKLKDTPAEGLLVPITRADELDLLCKPGFMPDLPVEFLALDLAPALTPDALQPVLARCKGRVMLVRRFEAGEQETFAGFADLAHRYGQFLAAEIAPENFSDFSDELRLAGDAGLVFTLSSAGTAAGHAI